MATNVTSIQFNGLTIAPGTNYTVTRAEGLTGLPIRTSEQLRTGASGGIFYKNLYGQRTISFEGRILTATADDFFNAQDAMLAAFVISDDPIALDITLWNGDQKTINCYVTETPMIVYRGGQATTATYRVELRAADAYFIDSVATTAQIYLADSGGTPILDGTPVPSPIIVAGNNYEVIDNIGDVPAYAKMTIFGSVINPSIQVINSNGTFNFSFTTTLTSSESIVIEVINGDLNVTKNGVNWLEYLSGDYPIFALGGNTVRYTAGTYDATSYVLVEFYNNYLSITG